MGFSLILRAFFSFPNERQFIECQFFWEFREKWGVTPRWINYYCSSGRIPGAVKMGTVWLIPKNAEKPIDGRTKKARSNRNGK